MRMLALLIVGVLIGAAVAQAQSLPNGTVDQSAAENGQAWNAEPEQWQPLEAFWLDDAERSGGLTWGRTDTYPAYGEVKEFDLIMIEVAEGPCLMEFFHRRWRRANDVRRWDEAFNEYGGCARVFE